MSVSGKQPTFPIHSDRSVCVRDMMRPEGGGDGVAVGVGLIMPGGGGRPSLWATPTPYLFLGLSVIMGVIVVALLVLVCTRREPASSSSSRRQLGEEAGDGDGGEKAASVRGVLVPLDREAPRVVVVMAGDAVPSFLASAKPLAVDPSGAAEAV